MTFLRTVGLILILFVFLLPGTSQFNAGGEIFELDGEPSNGSKARVSFELRPYATGSVRGVSLRLSAVQWLVLETRQAAGGGGDDFAGESLTDSMGSMNQGDF